MDKIRVIKENNSVLRIEAEHGIYLELSEHFCFYVPGYKFMPAYRNSFWDGKIRLFDAKKKHLPVGLFDRLVDFCKSRKYQIETVDIGFGLPGDKIKINPKEIWDFIQNLNLTSRGNKIQIRDYQFNAICKAIEEQRILLLSPTGSGKSLIIYCLLRWYQEHNDDKILIIVPTTSLVEQMYSDFEDYSSNDSSWNVIDQCHKIYSGKEKINVHNPVFISTWQSVYRLPPTWFSQFGCVFGDEAHLFKSKSLTTSMNKAINASTRIGTTGTLDGTKTNELVLRGVFGPVVKVTTTKKLQDKDTLAQLDINILQLIWPEEIRKNFRGYNYQQELNWLVTNEKRNKLIKKLAMSLDGNTLILFQFVEKHGKVLYKMIEEDYDHKIFYVSGEVDKLDREAIRSIVETQSKSIIVASSAVFSTGVNIRNIHNIIFSSPSKSQIRILQSIGRGLRKSDNGVTTQLYDLVDFLDWNKRKNFALKHGEQRIKIYDKERFNIKWRKMKL